MKFLKNIGIKIKMYSFAYNTTIVDPAYLLSNYSNNFYVLTGERESNPSSFGLYQTGKNTEDKMVLSLSGGSRNSLSMIFYHESQFASCNLKDTKFMRRVTFTADSKISVKQGCFSTNEFFLSERTPFDFNKHVTKYLKDFENFKEAVNNGLDALKYVAPLEQTFEMCRFVVQKNGFNLEHVANDEWKNELSGLAVQQNALSLKYVKNQTPEIVKLAVMNNPDALEFVEHALQTPELYRMLVK